MSTACIPSTAEQRFRAQLAATCAAFRAQRAELADLSGAFWDTIEILELVGADVTSPNASEVLREEFKLGYRQLGAPGDFGYGRSPGDDLMLLYRCWNEWCKEFQPSPPATKPVCSEDVKHFVDLAARGKHPGSSGGEKRARRLAVAVLENLPGLDDSAIAGLLEFVRCVQTSPSLSRQLVGIPD